MTDVSIIVVSYNTVGAIDACLQSIRRETARSIDYEIIVIDNASSDGSAEMLRTLHAGVQLIELGRNVGFAAACNQAARSASGKYLLLLNPDAQLVGDTVSALLEAASTHPDAGIYGGRSVHADGTVDPRSCWSRPTPWSLFCFATGLSTAFARTRYFDPESIGRWQRDSTQSVDVVTGFLMLVRRDTWEQLGGFDERFFLYGEDLDFSTRAKTAKWSPMITPDAVVIHAGGGSSATRTDKLVLLMAGKATFIHKHWHGRQRSFGIRCLLIGTAVRAALSSSISPCPWRYAWHRRNDWLSGYPPVGARERFDAWNAMETGPQ